MALRKLGQGGSAYSAEMDARERASRDEIMAWLFTEQDDLGLTPADALHTHSAREVIRRAQAQAF